MPLPQKCKGRAQSLGVQRPTSEQSFPTLRRAPRGPGRSEGFSRSLASKRLQAGKEPRVTQEGSAGYLFCYEGPSLQESWRQASPWPETHSRRFPPRAAICHPLGCSHTLARVLQGWYAMEGRCVRGLSVPRWADVPPALALILHGSTYKLIKAA